MTSKMQRLAVFAVPLVILFSIGMTRNSHNSADAQNSPGRPRPDNTVRRLSLTPHIPPGEAVEYTVIPAGGVITGLLGLPAAKLTNIPPELNEVAVWTPPLTEAPPLKPDAIAYELISSVRYRGTGKELVIATYRLSPAAAKLERFLGNTETLSDGTTVGVYNAEQSRYPNRIVFERSNLIIAIGGNLPIDQIKQIAATVQL